MTFNNLLQIFLKCRIFFLYLLNFSQNGYSYWRLKRFRLMGVKYRYLYITNLASYGYKL